MKLTQRISNQVVKLFGGQLGNSFNAGAVVRNLNTNSNFAPEHQLRGITYKVIDKFGSTLSVYEPQVFIKNAEQPLKEHSVYNWHDNPNPDQTGTDFIHLYGMLTKIYGETFWYLVRGENFKKIKEIILLNPAQVEIVAVEGEVKGYKLHKNDGNIVYLTADEVYHDKTPNPFNKHRGMSVLERASIYVDTEIETSIFTLAYMRNNASPSGIVTLPNMSEDAFRQFTSQWREGYEGAKNAGKTAFIRGGEAKFQAVGATLKEVDAKVIREMSKEDVMMMFDMPKAMLGISDDAGLGRASVETHEYIYNKQTLEPMMKRLDNIYEALTRMNGEKPVDVRHVNIIPEDKEFTHKQNKELVNIALTVNEVRANLGLEPIKGGDELMPKNVAPTTEVKSAKKIVMKKAPTKDELEKKKQIELDTYFDQTDEVVDRYMPKIKSKISKFADNQEKQIISKIDATTKEYDEWLYTVKDESEELAELLMPVFIELMEAQAENVTNLITGELLTITDEIRTAVLTDIKRISGIYNEETLKALQATIVEGRTAGESIVKIKKRVEQVYTDAKGYRAERIARTESLRSANLSAEYSYSQNGYSRVEWVNNPNACEFCVSLQGNTKAIGGNFLNNGSVITTAKGDTMQIDYDDISVPPLHPNCRCRITPID